MTLLSYTPRTPRELPCEHCGHRFAGSICPFCKEERSSYRALKRIAASRQPLLGDKPACRYSQKPECDCGLRGLCLEVA